MPNAEEGDVSDDGDDKAGSRGHDGALRQETRLVRNDPAEERGDSRKVDDDEEDERPVVECLRTTARNVLKQTSRALLFHEYVLTGSTQSRT